MIGAPARAARGKGEAGFTLVEALVAISLLALLMVMLANALRTATAVRERAGFHTDRIGQVALAHGFLRNQIAMARAADRSTKTTSATFRGGLGRLELLVPSPRAVAYGGFQLMAVELDPEGSGEVRVWTEDFRDDAAPAGARQRPRFSVLLRGIGRVEFGYFGAAPPESAPAWHEAWSDERRSPLLVRMRLLFGDGERAAELLAATRITVSAGRRDE